MKFFFDNTFSPVLIKFIAALAIEGHYEVKHLRDMFESSIKDHVWINGLAKDGDWVIITGDVRIAKNPVNKAALQESGLTIFYFPKGFTSMNNLEQSWRTIKVWPEIIKIAKKHPKGSSFKITGAWKIQ